MILGNTVGGSEVGNEKVISKSQQQETGARSRWGALGDLGEHASLLSHPRGEGVGVFIHLLPQVIASGLHLDY